MEEKDKERRKKSSIDFFPSLLTSYSFLFASPSPSSSKFFNCVECESVIFFESQNTYIINNGERERKKHTIYFTE